MPIVEILWRRRYEKCTRRSIGQCGGILAAAPLGQAQAIPSPRNSRGTRIGHQAPGPQGRLFPA